MKWPWQNAKQSNPATPSVLPIDSARFPVEAPDEGTAEKGSELLSVSNVESDALGDLAKLPPFRPVVISLMRLFDRADVTLADVAPLVESDPSLASEILAVVNSPLFAFRQNVASPAHAISLLGVERTKSVAATLAMRSLMQGGPRTPVVRRFWILSIATATIARIIAPVFGVAPEMAHVSALMHDLGRSGLLAAYPEEYAKLALTAHESTAQILEQESATLGMTHSHAGALLAKAWMLPAVFAEVTEAHHDCSRTEGCVGLVQLACLLADSFMYLSIHRLDVQKPEETIANFAPAVLAPELICLLPEARSAVDNAIQTLDF